jgi:hypothetical protein
MMMITPPTLAYVIGYQWKKKEEQGRRLGTQKSMTDPKEKEKEKERTKDQAL